MLKLLSVRQTDSEKLEQLQGQAYTGTEALALTVIAAWQHCQPGARTSFRELQLPDRKALCERSPSTKNAIDLNWKSIDWKQATNSPSTLKLAKAAALSGVLHSSSVARSWADSCLG